VGGVDLQLLQEAGAVVETRAADEDQLVIDEWLTVEGIFRAAGSTGD